MSKRPFMGRRGADPAGSPPDRRVRVGAGPGLRATQISHRRLTLVAAFFAVGFAVVGGRLVDLAAVGGADGGGALTGVTQSATLGRSDIVDRNGVVVASSLAVASLYAEPRRLPDAAVAAAALVAVLPGLDHGAVLAKLESGKSFVWLKRHLTPTQQQDINSLGLPGVGFRTEQRRVYPHGALAVHVVGFADIDNRGLTGIEQSFDGELRGASLDAGPLQLSLDLRVQYALHEELSLAMAEFHAVGAAGLVMDAGTGEVVAMVSLPDFDPNQVARSSADQRFNRASLGVYEMGSTWKILTVAMALDLGTARLEDRFDATQPLRSGRFVIRDDHPRDRWLSVPEIFIYSSNIGAARMAMEVGTDRQREFLGRMGLLDQLDVRLPEVGAPLVPNPWRDINTITVSYGHGLAVSPLQFAAAVATTINGGWAVSPTLVKSTAPPPRTRVLAEATSLTMRRLMRLNVEQGTGGLAAAPGFLVGGKTGTAEKVRRGAYESGRVVSSFVGAFPMNDPRYVVLALLDEPLGNESTRGFATAGWTAAPVVSRVIARIGPLLGVGPASPIAGPAQQALFMSLDGRTAGAAF